jgi:hypothetical protein
MLALLTFFVSFGLTGCCCCCCCSGSGGGSPAVLLLLLLLLAAVLLRGARTLGVPTRLLLLLDAAASSPSCCCCRGLHARFAAASLMAALVFAAYSGSCHSDLLRWLILARMAASSSGVMFCTAAAEAAAAAMRQWEQMYVLMYCDGLRTGEARLWNQQRISASTNAHTLDGVPQRHSAAPAAACHLYRCLHLLQR